MHEYGEYEAGAPHCQKWVERPSPMIPEGESERLLHPYFTVSLGDSAMHLSVSSWPMPGRSGIVYLPFSGR